MPIKDAGLVVALRPVIEALLVRCSDDPESITNLAYLDAKIVEMVQQLSCIDACLCGTDDKDVIDGGSAPPPPAR